MNRNINEAFYRLNASLRELDAKLREVDKALEAGHANIVETGRKVRAAGRSMAMAATLTAGVTVGVLWLVAGSF